MKGFQQRTAGSPAVRQQELKIDAITIRGADSMLGRVGRPSIIHGR